MIIAAALLLGACSASPASNEKNVASPVSSPRQVPATSSGATTPVGSAEPASAMLKCADYIDAQPPPDDFQIVLGVVALPTSPRAAALGTSAGTREPDPSLRLFAKTGLVIRAETRFELIVPEQPTGHLAIGWGPLSTPSRRVIVANCPDGRHTGWLAYPGGYWLSAPACISLIVRAGGKDQVVHIGLGTPCPGQQPPQGPSDR